MKKLLAILISLTLLLTSATTVFAYEGHSNNQNAQINLAYNDDKGHDKNDKNLKAKNHTFKINGSPVIKYGRYKLPISPVTKGMGATVTFDKATAVLTVTKAPTTIVIDFDDKTVTVNGAAVTDSGIFTAKNSKKMKVLIKYIATTLGLRADVDGDKVTVEVPGLNAPTNVAVTPIGGIAVANTLNSTTLNMIATAKITAGQATGGKAELYVGTRLIATDSTIGATDTSVDFTIPYSGTPTNAQLQAAIPTGGVVSVKLYNAAGAVLASSKANPTLKVDYIAPTITGAVSAIYSEANKKLYITVTGATITNDAVDVTKISLYDVSLVRNYTLTSTSNTGSNGYVESAARLVVNVGSTDKTSLEGFEGSDVILYIAAGSLLKDAAGNVSNSFASVQSIPVTVIDLDSVVPGLNAPTNVTVTPIGGTVMVNTLNSTNLYMLAAANITAGQATGGKAELYVGTRLVATDSTIGATDSSVNFTTNYAITNDVLKSIVPEGGVVIVKLYNAAGASVASTQANPTLKVDYVAPTITDVLTAVYDAINKYLYIIVTGADKTGDAVDVTKISLYDQSLGKTYNLTDNATTGSKGVVSSSEALFINIGSSDKAGLADFSGTDVKLYVGAGPLLKDAAGNVSNNFTSIQTIPVTVVTN